MRLRRVHAGESLPAFVLVISLAVGNGLKLTACLYLVLLLVVGPRSNGLLLRDAAVLAIVGIRLGWSELTGVQTGSSCSAS